MRKIVVIGLLVAVAIVGIIVLKHSSGASSLIWNISDGGAWLLPLVLVSSLLDSVHPCSFSILLITIAFLFGMQMTRGRILQIGGIYIVGIFGAYLLIGVGLLNALHLFDTPHFMGKLGASLLIGFGLINISNALFPKFPIKLKIPSVSHRPMAALMDKASYPAALGLGALVGICQFPCMGGPYLMVIGLLHDQTTYFTGFGYLTLYNAILIGPLAAVLGIAADKTVVDRVQLWKSSNLKSVRLWAGFAMIAIGILVFYI
jgi:cytochrome c-type biogenesis protein